MRCVLYVTIGEESFKKNVSTGSTSEHAILPAVSGRLAQTESYLRDREGGRHEGKEERSMILLFIILYYNYRCPLH